MRFLSFDGVAVSASEPIHVKQLVGEGTPYSINHQYQQRSRQHPVLEDVTYNELRIPFTVQRENDVDHDEVLSLFSVYGGFRLLEAEIGGTAVQVLADVASFQAHSETSKLYQGTFITNGVWQSSSLTGPVTTSPLTVEGNLHALPVITITDGGVAANRERYSIRDRTGRGLKAWDLRVPHNAAEVYVQGASIPFAVVGGWTWFRVGVRHDRPTLVDIRTGGDDSPMKDTLDPGTMVLAESTNTERKYSGWAISRNPGGAANQWRPGVSEPVDRSTVSITYGVENEDSDEWHVRLYGTSMERHRYAFANDYLSAMFTSPVEMSQITGLTRYLRKITFPVQNSAPGNPNDAYTVAFYRVAVRQHDQEEWITAAWARLSGWDTEEITQEGTINLLPFGSTGALQVSVTLMVPELGVSNWATEGRVTWYQHQPVADLKLSGDPVVSYRADKVPEITHLGSVAGRYVGNGALRNNTTDEEIRFDGVYYDSDGLQIDCNNLDINPVSGMHFGDITETDPAHLFKLVKGENHWSSPADLSGATVSFEWRERFIS